MLPEQVDNRGSLENVGTKWIQEINEHCPGVKIVLCALKCDLREEQEKDDDDEDTTANTNSTAADPATSARNMIQYNEGLEVARRIGALRYLGTFCHCRPAGLVCKVVKDGFADLPAIECSAMRNRGVNEAFTEAARVALQVKTSSSNDDSKCSVM